MQFLRTLGVVAETINMISVSFKALIIDLNNGSTYLADVNEPQTKAIVNISENQQTLMRIKNYSTVIV